VDAVVLALIWLFMLGGMKRELVPGRWQVAVEGVTGFVTSMIDDQHRARGAQIRALGVHHLHVHPVRQPAGHDAVRDGRRPSVHRDQPVHVTGVMAIISFSIVLIVGFWKHGCTSSRCSCPHGTPFVLKR
jgi:F-type H+-transporting ATPase subunit a